MINIGMVIELLETFRDRDIWKEGFMAHEDNTQTRKNICVFAIEAIKTQQKEIERLKSKPAVPKQQSFGSRNYVCPVCSLVLDEARDTFCPSCGTEIAWAEIEDGEQDG